MNTFNDFSEFTGLIVNPTKCKAYFYEMEDDIKEVLKDITFFTEGPLQVFKDPTYKQEIIQSTLHDFGG